MVYANKINLYTYKELRNEVKFDKSEIMTDAWWYFRNGAKSFSEALQKAWQWAKKWVNECREQIIRFEKMDAQIQADYEKRQNQPAENSSSWMDADAMSEFYNSNAYKGD